MTGWPQRHPVGVPAPAPRLTSGTELIGPVTDSGLREPPHLVRRCDGQMVQLSPLLYAIASRLDGRELRVVAHQAGERLGLRLSPALILHVAERKLAPLGLVANPDGTTVPLRPRNGLLALRFRAGVLPATPVNRVARTLAPLFARTVVTAAILALAGADAWLFESHALAPALAAVIEAPGLLLGLFALTILSLALHEFGHAAACRFGGARPGRIGVGIYLVWPVFFTDVTDSYRLPKSGRLRTDLGGVYFNALIAVGAFAGYAATSYRPLLVAAAGQQLLILNQFVPWIRLDGYHVVSDMIGVPDLFSRISPVIASLLPGRRADRRVTELKPWARAAVSAWVVVTVIALAGMFTLLLVSAPTYLQEVWRSLVTQARRAGSAGALGAISDAISCLLLTLPVVGLTLTWLTLCRGVGARLALRRSRGR